MKTPQPNSLHCFVCGIENPVGLHLRFYQTQPGEVIAEINIPEKFQGYPGIVHGGVVAAMLDEAAGRSQMGIEGDPRFMFTARLNIRYRKNVPIGVPLHLVGTAGETKSRTAEAHGAILDGNGDVLAEAEVVLVNVPDQMVRKTDLEELGWKVYPENQVLRG